MNWSSARIAFAALFGLALLGSLAFCPTSRAAPETAPAMNIDLIVNGGFENGLTGWYMEHAGSGSASLSVDTSTWASGLASARLTLVAQSGADAAAIHQDGIQVISGAHYTLSFWAKASQPRALTGIVIQQKFTPWHRYSDYHAVGLATEWRRYELDFISHGTSPTGGPQTARLGLALAETSGTVWLDDIRLEKTPMAVHPARATLKPGAPQRLIPFHGSPPYSWSNSNPAAGTLTPGANTDSALFRATASGVTTISVTDAAGATATSTIAVIPQSVITVDAGQVIRPVQRAAFGNNTGYSDLNFKHAMTDTQFISATRDLEVSVLRFPGGLMANYYDFSVEQGWASWAPNPSAQFNITKGVTTDQFLEFCQAVDCSDAMITANVYSRGNPDFGAWITPQVAADWVEHTNVVGDFPVRYWELGNEILAYMPSTQYIDKVHQWSPVMKAVDPAIEIGAVVETPMKLEQGEWINNAPIISQTADEIDFVIPHVYIDPMPYTGMDEGWRLRTSGSAQAVFRRDSSTAFEGAASGRISVVRASATSDDVILAQPVAKLLKDSHYVLSFWAKASSARPIGDIRIQHTHAITPVLADLGQVSLTTDWKHYELPFAMGAFPGPLQNPELVFSLGDRTGDVWIDSLTLLYEPTDTQVISHGGFDGEFGWYLWTNRAEGYPDVFIDYQRDTTDYITAPASLRVTLLTPVTNWNQLPIYNAPFPMTAGAHYTLSFWAKSSHPRYVAPGIPHSDPPIPSVLLSTQWQQFQIPFTATESDPRTEFAFRVEGPAGQVWFDSVSLGGDSTPGDLITNGGFDDEFFTDASALGTFAALQATEPISNLRHLLELYAPERASAIGIQASEWNIHPYETYPGRNWEADRHLTQTLYDAVLETDLLWDMIQEGVSGAQLWHLYGWPWGTLDTVPSLRRHAQYYAMQVSSTRSGDSLVESSISGPTYASGPVEGWGMTYAHKLADVPYLSVYPSKTTDGSRLYLIITNRSSQPETTTVELRHFAPSSSADTWQMTAPNWSDMEMHIQETSSIVGSTFTLTLPARSLSSLCLLANDFSGNGVIDVDDIIAVADHWHEPDPSIYDIDGNGVVDIVDVMLVAGTWGASCL